MPTRRRWALNYYITQCTGNSISWRSDELVIRCGRENQHPERLGPQALGWAAQENGKETRLWPIEWGSICCSSVWSPTPSHTQPFQIKWEVYFSKELCRSSLLCHCVLHACICICVCIVVHGYTTVKKGLLKTYKGGTKSLLADFISAIDDFFHQWDPRTATLMEVVCRQQRGLCWKINLI